MRCTWLLLKGNALNLIMASASQNAVLKANGKPTRHGKGMFHRMFQNLPCCVEFGIGWSEPYKDCTRGYLWLVVGERWAHFLIMDGQNVKTMLFKSFQGALTSAHFMEFVLIKLKYHYFWSKISIWCSINYILSIKCYYLIK